MKLFKQLTRFTLAAGMAAGCTLSANAQQVKLVIRYKPEQQYLTKLNMDAAGQVNFPVGTAVADSLKAKGLAANTNFAANASADLNIVTGKAVNGMVPVTMQLNNVSAQPKINGQQFPVPVDMLNGKMVYAMQTGADGQLKIDSVSGRRLPDSTLSRINSMMANMMGRMQLMNKTFKVGESYTQDVPLNMPMGKMNMPANAVTKVTYTLKRVSGDKAYFDLKQSTSFTDMKDGMQVAVNGTGTGSMVYETKQQYPSSFQSGMTVAVKSTSSTKGNSDIKFTLNTRGVTTMSK